MLRPLPDDAVMVVFQEDLPEPPEDVEEGDFEIHIALLSGPPGTPPIYVIGKMEKAVKEMVRFVIEDILDGRIDAVADKEFLH